MFERYSELLIRKFSADFDHVSFGTRFVTDTVQIVRDDDNLPMMVNDQTEFDQVSGVCWLATGEMESLAM